MKEEGGKGDDGEGMRVEGFVSLQGGHSRVSRLRALLLLSMPLRSRETDHHSSEGSRLISIFVGCSR